MLDKSASSADHDQCKEKQVEMNLCGFTLRVYQGGSN